MAVKKKEETHRIEIDGGYFVEIRQPRRAEIAQALGYMMRLNDNPDFIKAGECILLECIETASPEVKKENEQLWMAACLAAVQTVQLPNSTIKKN